MHDPREALAFFARVSRELAEQPTETATLRRIVERALDVVPGCEGCAISLRRRHGQVETADATSELVLECDSLQYALGEGPCLEATWTSGSYLVNDTGTDDRWRRWCREVAGRGMRSVLAIRLTSGEETRGALNLYSREPGAFDRDSVDLAVVYASHAATAMNNAHLVTGLETALQSRHLIGVAQGILMQRFDLDLDASFEVLRRYSSQSNVKLREVARMVVEQGRLPDLGDNGQDVADPGDADPAADPGRPVDQD